MESNNIQALITIVQMILAGIVAFATASYKFGKLEQKIEHLEEDNKDNKQEIRNIGKEVSEAHGQLMVNNPATYVQRKSPVSINDSGKVLLDKSGAKKFVDSNLKELTEKLKATGCKTAYDVQENSKLLIESYKDDDRLAPLKEYAFKQGIDLEIILLVMSLYFRDLSLPKYNFTDKDIDKTDPNKLRKK